MARQASLSKKYEVEFEKLTNGIKQSVNILNWKIVSFDKNGLIANSLSSLKSYGENIEITYNENGNVVISSKCKNKMQLVDWGKNKKNIDDFFIELNKILFSEIDNSLLNSSHLEKESEVKKILNEAMNTNDKNKQSSNNFLSIIQLISSILMFIIGIASIFGSIIQGIIFLVIGIILFPPLDNLLSEKYKTLKIPPALTKAIIIVILLIISSLFITENKLQKSKELYEVEQFQKSIDKLKEIKPSNQDERKLVNSLIIKYSDDYNTFKKDKNLFYFNRINELYINKNYQEAIKIYNKIDKKSPYHENIQSLIIKIYYTKDKEFYNEALAYYNKKEYQNTISTTNNISKYTDFYQKGLELKIKSENLLENEIAQKEKIKNEESFEKDITKIFEESVGKDKIKDLNVSPNKDHVQIRYNIGDYVIRLTSLDHALKFSKNLYQNDKFKTIDNYTIIGYSNLRDVYGNSQNTKVAQFSLNRSVANKINWNEMYNCESFEDILKTEGSVWFHPAITK